MNITILNPKEYPELADPEVVAMLQAFYSRSSKPIKERLKAFTNETNTGIKEALNKYVIGYGHNSIADCADLVIAIEGISIIGAKVIQDSPLYNGQETSTRYIDFRKQPLYCPIDNLKDYQQKMIDFYAYLNPLVLDNLKQIYSNGKVAEPDLHNKALNARTFDITRGYLPLGATTQLSWKVSLRKAKERLLAMSVHPLDEIKSFAQKTLGQLHQIYPHTFPYNTIGGYCADKHCNNLLDSYKSYSDLINYHDFDDEFTEFNYKYVHINQLDIQSLEFLKKRPKGVEVPYYFSQFGQFVFTFQLDYGSFRDLQRHRNGICRLPLVSTKLGFHDWYIEQLPESIQNEAVEFLADYFSEIDDEKILNEYNIQYFLPLGTLVNVQLTYGLAEAIYVAELRSSKTVHPTLRIIAHQMASAVKKVYPKIALYIDDSPDSLSITRGKQDITNLMTE